MIIQADMYKIKSISATIDAGGRISTVGVGEDSEHFYPYTESNLLGKGAFGAVYKAHSLRNNNKLCVAKHIVCKKLSVKTIREWKTIGIDLKDNENVVSGLDCYFDEEKEVMIITQEYAACKTFPCFSLTLFVCFSWRLRQTHKNAPRQKNSLF
jgi:serine/threonine protein kinase